jgi:hypothetical protein
VTLPDQSINQWFNTAAFSRAGLMYGNSPRNPLVGPGIKTWDLSGSKAFKMPRLESQSLLFRAEFFNTVQHTSVRKPRRYAGQRHVWTHHQHVRAEPSNPVCFEVYVLIERKRR